MTLLWHYTIRLPSHLGAIIRTGTILREGDEANRVRVGPVPPVLVAWFSTRQDFEPTACKLVSDRRRGVAAGHVAANMLIAARIGVHADVAPMNWTAYRFRCTAGPMLTKARREQWQAGFSAMEAGRQWGADPADWWATPDPVPAAHWKAVQVCYAGRWVDIDPAEAAAHLFVGRDLEAERERQYPTSGLLAIV